MGIKGLIRQFQGQVLTISLGKLGVAGLTVVQLDLLRDMIDSGAISRSSLALPWSSMGWYLLTFLAIGGVNYMTDKRLAFLQCGLTTLYEGKIAHKILHLPIFVLQKKLRGEVLALLSQDLPSVSNAFSRGIQGLYAHGTLVLGMMAYLVWSNRWVGVLAGVLVSTTFLWNYAMLKRLKAIVQTVNNFLGKMMGFIHESIANRHIIQLYRRQQHFCRRLHSEGLELAVPLMKRENIVRWGDMTHFLLGSFLTGLLLFGKAAGWRWIQMTWGEFVVMLSCLSLLYGWVKVISVSVNAVTAGEGALERIENFLQVPDNDSFCLVGPEVAAVHQGLILEDIWFAYQDYNYILKRVNLQIEKGQKVGIFGMTGMGKSSLINLITGLAQPVRGVVAIDNIPLSMIPPASLRRLVSVASQDMFLWPYTLQQNINVSHGRYSQEEIQQWLKKYGGEDILTKAGDRTLSDKGHALSPGERQLIIYLRALAQNTPIMILDEALSALDTKREESIIDDLLSQRPDLTLIMISHRIHLMQKMDTVVVLHEGKVSEVGSPKQLLSTNGIFQKLYRLQSIETTLYNILQLSIDSVVRDGYPRFHYVRNAVLARKIGEKLGMDEKGLRELEIAAFIYDIGKISVPEAVLQKKTRLSESEQKEMEFHVYESRRIANQIAKEMNLSSRVSLAIFHHHERWDGGGYPGGLKGAEIPLESRILALVDNYNAMMSDRPYRKALPKHVVNQHILMGGRKKQFDPDIVEAFVQVLLEEEQYRHSDLQRAQNYEQWLLHQLASSSEKGEHPS